MRIGSIKPEQKQELFEAVTSAYLEGPKLEDIAKTLGVGHRTLQRFMTSHNRKEWLEAQWLKQWHRTEDKSWDDHLFSSAGWRMDKVDAERRKVSMCREPKK